MALAIGYVHTLLWLKAMGQPLVSANGDGRPHLGCLLCIYLHLGSANIEKSDPRGNGRHRFKPVSRYEKATEYSRTHDAALNRFGNYFHAMVKLIADE